MMRTERNKDSIMLLGAALFVMGLDCLRMSIMGGVPMPKETHGSAMYEIPAEVWGLVVIGQSGLLFAGAYMHWKGVIAAAGVLGGLIYLALSVMADQASLGFIVSRGAAVFGILNTSAAAAALLDMFADWLQHQVELALDWIERQRGDE